MKEKPFALEFYSGIVTVETFYPGIIDSIWWAPENSVFSLGKIFIITIDNQGIDNGSIHVESGKKSTPKGSNPQWQQG